MQQDLPDQLGQALDMQEGYDAFNDDDGPPITAPGATERGAKRARVDAFGEELADDPKYSIFANSGANFNSDDYKVFNPQTHRIVWLRLPRFTGSLEIQDINKGAFLPTTFLNQKGTKYCIENCGTRVRGYSEWNILKPEITNTGGTTAQIAFDHTGSTDKSYAHAGVLLLTKIGNQDQRSLGAKGAR